MNIKRVFFIINVVFISVMLASCNPAYAQAAAKPTPTPTPTPQSAVKFTPNGNLTLVDDISGTTAEEKQFITVETKDGNIFYIIIDRAGDKENVYFLNMVDELDLMALIEKDDKKSQSNGIAVVTSPSPTPTPEPTPPSTEEPKKSNNPTAILLLLLALGGGGAYYYFKVLKSKTPKISDADIEDFDFEYEEAEATEDTETETDEGNDLDEQGGDED